MIQRQPSNVSASSNQSADPQVPMISTPLAVLARTRPVTLSVETFDDVHEVFAENQDLHARIADLQTELLKLEEDNAEMSARLCQADLQSSVELADWKCRPSIRTHLGCSASMFPLVTRESVEALASQRVRLLWQKAILAVRLRCSVAGRVASKIRCAGIEHQLGESRSLARQLEQQLSDCLQVNKMQEARFEVDVRNLIDTFSKEKMQLEQASAEQAHKQPGMGENPSLEDDLETAEFDADDQEWIRVAEQQEERQWEIAEQEVQIKELRSYTKVLERSLGDALVDHEELRALRQRVLQLEKVELAGETVQGLEQIGQQWWCGVQRNCCATARSWISPHDPPLMLGN